MTITGLFQLKQLSSVARYLRLCIRHALIPRAWHTRPCGRAGCLITEGGLRTSSTPGMGEMFLHTAVTGSSGKERLGPAWLRGSHSVQAHSLKWLTELHEETSADNEPKLKHNSTKKKMPRHSDVEISGLY